MHTTTLPQHPNLVAGTWRPSASGAWIDVHDPADERQVFAQVPAMTAADIQEVYAAAVEGAATWAATAPVARGRVLLRAAHLLRERQAEVAHDLSREMGKTLAEAMGEVGKSADFLEYCGGLGRAPQGDLLSDERPGVRAWTVREPVGVVLAICPWNDPLLTPARKLGPALIAGNAVILKPASYTPVVSLHLARALADAGLPSGVLGTVTGSGREISPALLGDPALDAVSFTGSNAVGEELARELVGRPVKLLAELGGKNAAVVLADADLDLAAATIAAAAFAQAGQRCTATSRVLVAPEVLEPLLEHLRRLAEAFVLGAGVSVSTTMGPVVAPGALQDIAGFVDRARAHGAEILTGGARADGARLEHGNFFAPTILANVQPHQEIWTEEVFGPVIAVSTAEGLDAAVAAVNASRYGLAASIFTTSLPSAMSFIDGAATGHVSVNLPTSGWDVHMPFGGWKDSGSGAKEQGLEGVAWYTRTKTVALA
jgi:acyl-CoA reductase-like NAD-dependent aldehyde dehydrogenase